VRENLVPVMAILIILAFVGLAYYYWHGGGQSQRAVTGVVIDKYERPAGTEAGGVLQQGMRTITGQSFRQETFYFIRVRTAHGKEVEMEVSRPFYKAVEIGHKVRRDKPDSEPYIIGADSNIYL